MKTLLWETNFARLEYELKEDSWKKCYYLTIKEGVQVLSGKMCHNTANNLTGELFCEDDMLVSIPNSVKAIETATFSCTSPLRRLVIPDSVELINEHAFGHCTNLEEITLPRTLTRIGHRAFEDCWSLRRVEIPETVTKIEKFTFMGCDSLEEITLRRGLAVIENGAFCKCKKLRRIEIPETVVEFGVEVFKDCSSLEEIIVPEHILLIKSVSEIQCGTNAKVVASNGNAISPWARHYNETSTKTVSEQKVPEVFPAKEEAITSNVNDHKSNVSTAKFYTGATRKNLIVNKKKTKQSR